MTDSLESLFKTQHKHTSVFVAHRFRELNISKGGETKGPIGSGSVPARWREARLLLSLFTRMRCREIAY
jgi:hypothetical protein